MSDSQNPQALTYAETINYMDQMPSADSARVGQSPLHHAALDEAAKTQVPGSVTLTELALRGHIVLRGKLDNAGFTEGVQKVTGMALPGKLQRVTEGELSIRWISPDEWLLVVPGERTFEIEKSLVETMQGHCAVVNVSGAQTILRLGGKDAVNVLKKSIPYDVHANNFPLEKTVTTVFAKTQAIVTRVADDQWELVVRRSFSDYAWAWIQDASAEFGLVIKAE
ncbi:MAG: sarcosine oxidase subunit gamma [Pseudomonadales bacterium]